MEISVIAAARWCSGNPATLLRISGIDSQWMDICYGKWSHQIYRKFQLEYYWCAEMVVHSFQWKLLTGQKEIYRKKIQLTWKVTLLCLSGLPQPGMKLQTSRSPDKEISELQHRFCWPVSHAMFVECSTRCKWKRHMLIAGENKVFQFIHDWFCS